jgi:pimeloyl-ACP methyl ester carboxylesterase
VPSALVNGVRLNYLDQGEGEPVFLLHGNAGSCQVWRKVVPALSARHRVIAHDRRGFGHSDKGEAGDFSPRAFARELAGLMDALGVGRAHVGGVSFGGFVAQCFALAYPERVASLILVGTSADRTGRSVPDTLTELARDGWAAVADRLVRSWFRPGADPADVRETYEIALQSSQRVRELTVRALGDFDIREEIGRIAAPTLILTGRQDITCPPATAEDMARRIPGAELELIDACGHLVPVEQPQAFADRMLRFLAEVDRSG